MKKPRRPRAANTEPLERICYAVMHDEALRLARWLSVGFDLSPGDRDRLARMPPAVQAAVRAQRRAVSRYLPGPLQRHRATLRRMRSEGLRARLEHREWSLEFDRRRKSASRRLGHDYEDPIAATVEPPAYTNGSRRIIAAIAASAGVSPATIRAWADALRDELDEADGVRRPAHARQRPAGWRQSK
jgi:hypothetical protein